MSSDGLHKSLLQIIGLGVATVQPDSLEILFENSRFFAWFKPKGDDLELLQERVAGLNVAEASDLGSIRGGRSASPRRCATVRGP